MKIINFDLRSTVQGWNLHPIVHNALVYSMDGVIQGIIDKLIGELSRQIIARSMGVEPSRLVNVTEKTTGDVVYYEQCTTDWFGEKTITRFTYTSQEKGAFSCVSLMIGSLSLICNFSSRVAAIYFLFSNTLGYSRTRAFSWKQQACIMLVAGVTGTIFRMITTQLGVRYLPHENHPLLARITRAYVIPFWQTGIAHCFIGYALQMEGPPTGSYIRDCLEGDHLIRPWLIRETFDGGCVVGDRLAFVLSVLTLFRR